MVVSTALLVALLAPPLDYVEYVTAGAKPNATLPMVVAVHGLGDRPERFVKLFVDYPAPIRVVAPRGPIAHGRGFSWFPVRLPVRPDDEAMRAGITASARKLAALTRDLAKRRPTTGRPVVTGFSQGGILSFALAVTEPDLFAAAIPVAGTLPPALWPATNARVVPIHALHGDADRVVPLKGARLIVQRAAGAELRVFPGVAHRVPPPVRAALFERVEAATR